MNELELSLRVWRPVVWQLELRRDPQGELAQVMLREGAMGFSRIPERKSAATSLDRIAANGLDSESLHMVVLRAFFVMSQSISEWMFRPIFVRL